jgi:hypothetical protein
VADPESWTCPSCNQTVLTPYCPACGERCLRPRELTLRGLIDQVFEAFTNIDGRLLRSFTYLIGRPGALTVAFLQGRRKPFVGPVALFLVTNVLFFAAESLTGGTIFSTPLEKHLHAQPWSELAQGLVAGRLASLHTSVDLFAPRFDSAIALHARSLILLMALAFAVLPAIAFNRSGRPFAAHVVFSLHLYGFMLLLFCVGTAIPAAGVLAGSGRSDSQVLDGAISIALLAACGTYLYFATGAVYGGGRAARGLKAAALAVGAAVIVLGYRFALLLITLYSA